MDRYTCLQIGRFHFGKITIISILIDRFSAIAIQIPRGPLLYGNWQLDSKIQKDKENDITRLSRLKDFVIN